MAAWLWLAALICGSQSAILAPPWADIRRNPCASHPRGWLMLYWPSDGKCYTIYKLSLLITVALAIITAEAKSYGYGAGNVDQRLLDTLADALKPVQEVTKAATDAVASTAGDAVAVANTANDATEAVANTTDNATEAVANTADDATEAVANTTDNATEAVANTAGDAVEAVANTADDATEAVANTADDATETVANTTDNATEAVANTTEDAKKTVEKTAGDASEAATQTVNGATETVAAPVKTLLGGDDTVVDAKVDSRKYGYEYGNVDLRLTETVKDTLKLVQEASEPVTAPVKVTVGEDTAVDDDDDTVKETVGEDTDDEDDDDAAKETVGEDTDAEDNDDKDDKPASDAVEERSSDVAEPVAADDDGLAPIPLQERGLLGVVKPVVETVPKLL